MTPLVPAESGDLSLHLRWFVDEYISSKGRVADACEAAGCTELQAAAWLELEHVQNEINARLALNRIHPDEIIHLTAGILRNVKAKDADRLAAARVLGKWAGLEKNTLTVEGELTVVGRLEHDDIIDIVNDVAPGPGTIGPVDEDIMDAEIVQPWVEDEAS